MQRQRQNNKKTRSKDSYIYTKRSSGQCVHTHSQTFGTDYSSATQPFGKKLRGEFEEARWSTLKKVWSCRRWPCWWCVHSSVHSRGVDIKKLASKSQGFSGYVINTIVVNIGRRRDRHCEAPRQTTRSQEDDIRRRRRPCWWNYWSTNQWHEPCTALQPSNQAKWIVSMVCGKRQVQQKAEHFCAKTFVSRAQSLSRWRRHLAGTLWSRR